MNYPDYLPILVITDTRTRIPDYSAEIFQTDETAFERIIELIEVNNPPYDDANRNTVWETIFDEELPYQIGDMSYMVVRSRVPNFLTVKPYRTKSVYVPETTIAAAPASDLVPVQVPKIPRPTGLIIYYNGQKVSSLSLSPRQTVGDLKRSLSNWLVPQGIVKYQIRLVFNNGTELNKVVFQGNAYDQVNFEAQKSILPGSSIYINTQ